MNQKPSINGKRPRGRPESLKQGHRVVAVSLDPSDLQRIDSLVLKLREVGIIGEGPTRSSVIRKAIRRMIEQDEGVGIEILTARFLVVPD